MNTELIIKLETIINVLETIDVKGQANLLNLGGSIAALKELHDQFAQNEARKRREYHKRLLTFILINSIAMMWCSYLLAWCDKAEIAEALSKTVTTSIVGVVIPYLITKTIENVSKYGSRLNNTAKETEIDTLDYEEMINNDNYGSNQ